MVYVRFQVSEGSNLVEYLKFKQPGQLQFHTIQLKQIISQISIKLSQLLIVLNKFKVNRNSSIQSSLYNPQAEFAQQLYRQSKMSQTNHYFGSSIRNSYGYQDQSANRTNVPVKNFQPYSSSFQHDTKVANSIRAMESRVDGVQALVRQKKNSINQELVKPSSNTQNNAFQVYEPVKFNSTFNNNSAPSSLNEQRGNQLRGSCPNIFKKLDQTASNLRSTTQFVNMSKWGFGGNDANRKQPNTDDSQNNGIVRTMKKHSGPFVNEQHLNTSQSTHISRNQPLNATKIQTFNPNKSLSSGQLPSFRYNPINNLNKSNINRQKFEKETHSPARIVSNRTPTKFSKMPQFDKKSPQNSIKTSKTSANSSHQHTLSASIAIQVKTSPNGGHNDAQQKKFKSLHQIWEIKQKQKTQKKISQGIKNNSLQKSKNINGFQIGKVLGKGKFGQVFLARHQETGFVAAIKKIVKGKVKQYKMVDQFSKQIKLHNALDHPNIVKFFGFFQQDEDIYLVMEYMNGGTLFDYLNEVYHLGVKQTIQFLRDIIEAIVYLHQKSIAHRDIKPQNIVISSEGVAKLCDFGWSAVIQTSRKTYCGTFDYAPPQILQRKNYDMSVDVWCIGVLTYELLTGRVPFEGQKRNEVMQKIVNVDKNKIVYPIDVPKQAKDFIELLVQKQPSLRPKPTQLLKHPFFSLCPPKVKSKKLQ